MDSSKVIRPLGYNEQYELAQYTLGYHGGVSTACRYAIPEILLTHQDYQKSLKYVVYGAIAHVISDSAALQATIKNAESKKPVWVHIGSVDLSKHVEWIEVDNLTNGDQMVQEKICTELDSKFADLNTRPGWRVVVLQHTGNKELDVVFTWNHAHTDGMGGRLFHEKLLKDLIKETNSDPTIQVEKDLRLEFPDTPTRFPLPTESFVDLPMSPGFLLQQAWNESKPNWLFPKPSAAKWAPIRVSQYKTKFRTCNIDSGTLSGVLKACRGHKTTLTALMHGLVLLSLTSQLDENAARAFASLTAIDQRRFLPSHPAKCPWLEPSATMLNYVSNVTHEFDSTIVAQIRSRLSGKSQDGSLSTDQLNLVWSASSTVREDIEKRLQKGLKDDRLALMRFVTNARAQFAKEAQKPRALSWAISNLGVMEGTPKGEARLVKEEGEGTWGIRRAQFTLSAHVTDAPLLISAISLKGEDLVITCTWQDVVVEDAMADRLVKDLERYFAQIGGS